VILFLGIFITLISCLCNAREMVAILLLWRICTKEGHHRQAVFLCNVWLVLRFQQSGLSFATAQSQCFCIHTLIAAGVTVVHSL
jgi:hypothetical protein